MIELQLVRIKGGSKIYRYFSSEHMKWFAMDALRAQALVAAGRARIAIHKDKETQ